ncbi:MAG: AMP-binding protein [Candidatus Eremiobacteraeota bacterium]|nr:AMP-binding protein [Candidatus Eremiobacteraeota bacterium]
MTDSAHVDTFARDHLPPKEQWPAFLFARPEFHYPERMNCADRLLDRHGREGNGSRRCLVSPNVSWTYAETLAHANRIARVLVEDLGVVPGNRVLLRAPNSPMLAACWFGVVKAGAIAVTTMPLYRIGELQYMIEKVQIRHALCDERLRDDLDAAAANVGGFHSVYFSTNDRDGLESRMARKPATFENVDTAADDVALIGFTSGTTGKAKATMHFHRDVMAACDAFPRSCLRASSDDLFTGSPPLGFTFGLGGLLHFPLHIGAAALLLEKASPETLLQAVQDYGASVLFTAPIAYRSMIGMVDKYDLRGLRKCVSAGETLPRATWEGFFEKTGVKIIDGIGGTEMLHIYISAPEEEIRPGSTGKAVPGYEARVVDDAGDEVPAGTVGRLSVRGPTGCRYLDDARQTVYVQNGWNYPGDAYRMDEDGYFWYVARADDMIIAAGYNISGPEVEEALLSHTSVKECAVVSAPDVERGTNMVKAFVVLNDGCVADDEQVRTLQEWVKSRIATYKAPRAIEFVAALPRTETGKLQRFVLRDQERARSGNVTTANSSEKIPQ